MQKQCEYSFPYPTTDVLSDHLKYCQFPLSEYSFPFSTSTFAIVPYVSWFPCCHLFSPNRIFLFFYVSISQAVLWDSTTGARMTIMSSTNDISMNNLLFLSLMFFSFDLMRRYCVWRLYYDSPHYQKVLFFFLSPRFIFLLYATTFVWFFLKHEYVTIMANT